MKKLIVSLLIVLSLPMLIMTINILIDYRGIVNKSKFIERLVSNQMKGINQVLYVNYPERELVIKRIKSLENNEIDTIIIGSSKCLLFGESTNISLLNFSVSSANLIDYQEIFRLIKIHNLQVKNIIIEFHRNLFVEKFHNRHEIFTGLSMLQKIKFVFSFNYLKDNLKKKSEILDVENNHNFKLFYDGSIDYKDDYYSNSLNQKLKERLLRNEELSIKNKKLLTNGIKIFDSLIKNQNSKISLFISPLHPSIEKTSFSHLRDLKGVLDSIVSWNPNINIIGDFNSSKYNLNDFDFFDANHIKPNGIKKIMEKHDFTKSNF